mmetsp:Transcript_116660/g.238646  ORF Transcript_116660/g.238646 Transcript_116660/m.238646 type:complete len:119 (+) Transcript_116660:1973-2329(+)
MNTHYGYIFVSKYSFVSIITINPSIHPSIDPSIKSQNKSKIITSCDTRLLLCSLFLFVLLRRGARYCPAQAGPTYTCHSPLGMQQLSRLVLVQFCVQRWGCNNLLDSNEGYDDYARLD